MGSENNSSYCKLNLKIERSTIEPILEDLKKDFEISGVIKFNDNGETEVINKNNGSSDAVLTTNHLINYHTHPISAYINASTVWGWPSGEDIRETIKFGLEGNKGHIVFTVEGIYTIQVSQCKIKKMKNLTNKQRGIVVFLIEEYFKATHNFRGTSEVNKLYDNGIKITPESYCDLVNHFDLGSLVLTSKTEYSKLRDINKNSSRLPNNGFLEISNGKVYTLPIKEYILDTDLVYNIDSVGKEHGTVDITIDKLISELSKINKILGIKKCVRKWNNSDSKWFFINFFPNKNYISKKFINKNGTFIKPDKNESVLLDSEEPYIKLFSNNSEGCSIKTLEQKNNFASTEMIKKNTKKSKNTFGENQWLDDESRSKLHSIIIFQFNIIEVPNTSENKKFINELNYLVKNVPDIKKSNKNGINYYKFL